MLEFKFDTQLLIEGHDLDEDAINDYFTENFKGDCLLAVGDDELIKIHYHTNEPWKVLEYCASLGEIYDVVVENMERQEQGLRVLQVLQILSVRLQYQQPAMRSQQVLPVLWEADAEHQLEAAL